MKVLRIDLVPFLAVIVSGAFILGCGASPARKLVSVTISPSSAGAKSYPSGQVPFIATGHYNTSPYDVTPLQATWGASASPARIASVTQSGVAICTKAASGITTIEAWVSVVGGPLCNVIDSAGRPCGTVGAAATLTCP